MIDLLNVVEDENRLFACVKDLTTVFFRVSVLEGTGTPSWRRKFPACPPAAELHRDPPVGTILDVNYSQNRTLVTKFDRFLVIFVVPFLILKLKQPVSKRNLVLAMKAKPLRRLTEVVQMILTFLTTSNFQTTVHFQLKIPTRYHKILLNNIR